MVENEQVMSQKTPPEMELQYFKNVNSTLMQDALNVWADLWAELDSSRGRPPLERDAQNGHGHSAKFGAEDGFEPSCGWAEFLQKMWVLRYYVDFAKRLSQQ